MSFDQNLRDMQAWIVTVDNDMLQALVSVTIAELAIRYGSEKIENTLTEMLVMDEFHELAASAIAEREELNDVADMTEHDIVSEAQAILDES